VVWKGKSSCIKSSAWCFGSVTALVFRVGLFCIGGTRCGCKEQDELPYLEMYYSALRDFELSTSLEHYVIMVKGQVMPSVSNYHVADMNLCC
jgi:hypothetical protein